MENRDPHMGSPMATSSYDSRLETGKRFSHIFKTIISSVPDLKWFNSKAYYNDTDKQDCSLEQRPIGL